MKNKYKTEVRTMLDELKSDPYQNQLYLNQSKYKFFVGTLKNINKVSNKKRRLLMKKGPKK